MRYIAIRLLIAVLTFVIGTMTALWVRSDGPHSRPAQAMDCVVALPTLPLKEEHRTCDQSAPEVKWIFINSSEHEAPGWSYANVVIFYENGDWVRVGDTVRRDGTQFMFSRDEYYGAEVGRWTVNENGSFAVEIETPQRILWKGGGTETWLIGANEAFLTKQAGLPRSRVATRFLQIGYSQLVNGAREDGQSPLAIKQLFDPCRIRRAESVVVD